MAAYVKTITKLMAKLSAKILLLLFFKISSMQGFKCRKISLNLLPKKKKKVGLVQSQISQCCNWWQITVFSHFDIASCARCARAVLSPTVSSALAQLNCVKTDSKRPYMHPGVRFPLYYLKRFKIVIFLFFFFAWNYSFFSGQSSNHHSGCSQLLY